MRGIDTLIAMRRNRRRPSLVTVETDARFWSPKLCREMAAIVPGEVQLLVEPSDNLARLDLRSVIGCHVHLHGTDRDRLVALSEAMQSHDAARVVTHVRAADGIRLTELIDTEGTIQWLKS